MIVAFDLDDTLYPEETFVRSGFRAVAHTLQERFAVSEADALDVMWDSLERRGRGTQFDDVVDALGLRGRQSVRELIKVYRHHRPSISLPQESSVTLKQLQPRPLYVVTDGHKIVQQNKIDALGIAPSLRHAYITHRYGVHNRKPSTYVFELMMRRERCRPRDVVYIGDDPTKDFRALRPLGVRTVRVRTGRHSGVEVPASEDAELAVESILEVPNVISEMETTTA
ncbi:MAG: HAD family hydrolase [Solirubrobacteraceae bacterium]